MKNTLICALFMLSAAFAGYSQSDDEAPKRLTKKEAAEKQAVEKAAAKFMAEFDESLDIASVPRSLFVKGYEHGQPSTPLDWFETNINESTDPKIREKRIIDHINLVHLIFTWEVSRDDSVFLKKMKIGDDDDDEEEEKEDDEARNDPSRILPPEIIAALEESARGREMLRRPKPGDDQLDLDDAAQLDLADRSFENAIRLFRVSFGNRGEWLSKAAPTLNKIRNVDARSGAENCSDECLGMPEGTKIYYRTMLPFCLHFVREGAEFKVVAVHPSFGD